MKASVIIPVYNRPGEVAEAIQSALDQSLAPFEILVIDDGSTDDTPEVVKGFGAPVRLIQQENQGPAAARNRGAREAKGDWLAFLDSDDLWLAQKLEMQAEMLGQHPEAALIHTNGWAIKGREVPGNLSEIETYFTRVIPARGPDALKIYLAMPILSPSVMITREAFFRAGGFDESFKVNEDADLYVRIMAMGFKVEYVPSPLVIIRILAQGPERTWMEVLSESIRLQKKALKSFPDHRKLFRAALGQNFRNTAVCALAKGDGLASAGFLGRSFFYRRPRLKDLAALALLAAGGRPGQEFLKKRWKKSIERFK